MPCSAGKGPARRAATTCRRPWTGRPRSLSPTTGPRTRATGTAAARGRCRPQTSWAARAMPWRMGATTTARRSRLAWTPGAPPPAPGRAPRPPSTAGASPRRTASLMGRAIPPRVRPARGARAAWPRSHWGGLSALTRRRPAPRARSRRRVRATQAAAACPGGWRSPWERRGSSACVVGRR